MNNEPPKRKSKATPGKAAAAYSVLARLPDVADQQPLQARSNRAASAGFVDYRFDLPAGAEQAESRPRLRVQSPSYRRAARSERPARTLAASSRVLPSTGPFTIPSVSMVDRLAPVARFLALFLVFTAIGTFVLSTTRERSAPPKHHHVPSAAAPAGIEQTLEPTTNDAPPKIATPEAFGPLGANVCQPAEEDSATSEASQALSATESTPKPAKPVPLLAGANGQPLPQVQTTEITPAADELGGDAAPARFTGTIGPGDGPPTNAAARPPEVARRLPAIFDAPRHAYQ